MSLLPTRYQEYLENPSEESEAEAILEEFQYWNEHPLHYIELDKVSLDRIPLLSDAEIRQIWEVISQHPELSSWNTAANLLDDEVMEILKYCTRLDPSNAFNGNVRWRVVTDEQEDYQWYTRLQMQLGNSVTGGVVMERDQGELSLTDHVSGGITWRNNRENLSVLVGDFKVGYGQGLSFGRALGFSKSGDVIRNADKSYTTLRNSTSSLESSGFRGVAGKLSLGSHTVQAFWSSAPRDGQWDGEQVRLSTSGKHVTDYTRNSRNAIVESSQGVGYWYTSENIEIGVQGARQWYHRWDNRERLLPVNFGSLWFSTPWCFHETAIDADFNRAHVLAFQGEYKQVQGVIGYRFYSPSYSVPFAGGFSEFSGTDNEMGLYIGLRWDFDRFRWQCYFDEFQEIRNQEFPRRSGTEWLVRSDWRPAPRMSITGQVKHEIKEIKETFINKDVEYTGTVLRQKGQYRLRWSYRWESDLALDVRTDYTKVHQNERRYTGIQWAYTMRFPTDRWGDIQLSLISHDVDHSQASTYYVIMPVHGSMRIMQQATTGIVVLSRWITQVGENTQVSIFYLQRRMKHPKLSHTLFGQIEIAF